MCCRVWPGPLKFIWLLGCFYFQDLQGGPLEGCPGASHSNSDLAELDEVPWVGSWWSQILGYLQKLGNLAGDALHAEIFARQCA